MLNSPPKSPCIHGLTHSGYTHPLCRWHSAGTPLDGQQLHKTAKGFVFTQPMTTPFQQNPKEMLCPGKNQNNWTLSCRHYNS